MATGDMELGVVGPVAVPEGSAAAKAGAATGEEGEEGTDRCCICMSAPATCRLEPCGHRVVCDDNDCRVGVQEHGKCPLCRSAPKTMLDASGQVIFDQFKTMLPENLHGVGQVTPAVVCSGLCAIALFLGLHLVLIALASVFAGLIMGAAASGSAANATSADNAGEVDLALACRVSVASYSGAVAAVFGVLVLFVFLLSALIMNIPARSREVVKLMLGVIMLLGLGPLLVWVFVATVAAISKLPEPPWLAAIAFCCSLLCNCVMVNPQDPPGTRPANRMNADERERRRRWNTLVSLVQHFVQAILTWAFLFQLKLERFQGRAQYEDPYGVAIYGALLTGLLRVPFATALFPAMFPLLFTVNLHQ